jgi:hypothetical protein
MSPTSFRRLVRSPDLQDQYCTSIDQNEKDLLSIQFTQKTIWRYAKKRLVNLDGVREKEIIIHTPTYPKNILKIRCVN